MGRPPIWLIPWLGCGLAQGILWLHPDRETIIRLPSQGSLLELWAPFGHALEGPLQSNANDRQLQIKGSGRLLLSLAGQQYTVRLTPSPLGYSTYQLRPAIVRPQPPGPQPLPNGLLPQLFWIGPSQLGYSLLNLSSETLQLDPELLEIALGSQRLTPPIERYTNAPVLGVLPPQTAEYGLVTLPTGQPYQWRWLLPGIQNRYLWEGQP